MTKVKKQYAALALGTCVVCLGALFAFISPTINQLRAIETETIALNSKLSGYLRSLDMINAYIARRDSLDQRRVELTARLYARDDVLALIDRLKDLANTSGVTVQEISPSVIELLALNDSPPVKGVPQQVNISLRVSGGAFAAGSLLKELEQESYFVDLLTMHIVGRDQGHEPADYVFTFRAQLGALPVETMVLR